MKEPVYTAKIAISKEDVNKETVQDLICLFRHWKAEDTDPKVIVFYKDSTNKTELGTEFRKISMKLGGKVIREEMTKVSNVYSNIDD